MKQLIALTIATACLFTGCASKDELSPKILQAKNLPNTGVPIASLVKGRWEQVCAATVTFGAALAEASGVEAQFREIEASPGYSDDQGRWFLAVFHDGVKTPALHVFSRKTIPFVDAMLLGRLPAAVSYTGRPVTCTANPKATIQAISLENGDYVFSLLEPN
jgi:hypothetical protein